MAPKANSEKDKKDKKDGYRVNIELKDQLNNIFYIATYIFVVFVKKFI